MPSLNLAVSPAIRERLRATGPAILEALSRGRLGLLAIVGIGLLPFGIRMLVMAEGGYAAIEQDLSGICSDIGVGLAVASLLALAFRWSRIAFFVFAAIWLALNAGFYEFFREYESPYFLIHSLYLFDPAFLVGSGTHFSHPLLMLIAAAALPALSFVAGRGRHAVKPPVLMLLAALGIAFAAVQPWSQFASPWRQRNFVSLNISDVTFRLLWPDQMEAEFAASASMIADAMRPDLNGVRLTPVPTRPRNVILVFIEGGSGGYLPSLAGAQGVDSTATMPLLDEWAQRGLSYSNFMTHQRQSNRGLYAALCGDLPRLTAGLAEMTTIADSPNVSRKCLPQILADHGYESLFLNAASGSFMQMNRFMHKAGFRREQDVDDYDPALVRGHWGVNDDSLYGVAMSEVDALSVREKPFFLTIFTSSTHHPYGVPDTFRDHPELEPHERSVAFSDRAVADFLSGLAVRGRLDDTLVIVTSDEAAQLKHAHRPDLPGMMIGMTENWGFVVALSPESPRRRIDRTFQQADIALSILDYFGLGDDGFAMTGRSIFREYASTRSIYSANIYKRRIQEYVEGKSLTICDESLSSCRAFDAGAGSLFGPTVKAVDGEAEPSKMLRAIRAYSSVRSPIRTPAWALPAGPKAGS